MARPVTDSGITQLRECLSDLESCLCKMSSGGLRSEQIKQVSFCVVGRVQHIRTVLHANMGRDHRIICPRIGRAIDSRTFEESFAPFSNCLSTHFRISLLQINAPVRSYVV